MRWEIPSEASSREQALVKRLRRASKFFAFLWEIRGQLFTDDFQDELIGSFERHRSDNVPPALLAMVWLLQAYTHASDRDAVDNAMFDRRWQLVLGTLGQEDPPFGQGSLPRFRARLIRANLDQRLVDRTVELARETGLFGWRNLKGALDSSPLRGAGRVEDTWNLIGRAMGSLVAAIGVATGQNAEALVSELQLTGLGGSSLKATLDIDWNDEQARAEAFGRLVDEAQTLRTWVEQQAAIDTEEPPVSDAMADLTRVLDQDTEPDPAGGSRLKRGVARDRMPSLGDREMRHGRKSRTKKFTGYKRYFAVIEEARLVAGALAEPANVAEQEATGRLVEALRRHGQLVGLDFDRGFLGSSEVPDLEKEGVVLRCKPWPARNRGRFTKLDFHLDLTQAQATCPADIVVPIRTGKSGERRARWRASDCQNCPLKEQCTTSKRGRTVQVHRREELLQRLRTAQSDATGRAELRERVVVEHLLGRLQNQQGSRARYKGTRKNTMDVRRYAALSNLFEVRRHIEKAA